MAESPKRRKCKDNPYTLNYIEEKNIYTITFKDVKGHLNKVKVKLIFETTMDHSQTSMKKAQEDVNRVLTDYLKDKKLNVLNLFNDRPPRIINKVEKKDD